MRPIRHIQLEQLRKVAQPITLPPSFYDPERDGITFSVLDAWKTCREKSRLGLRGLTSSQTSTSMVFGTIAHATLQAIYNAFRRNEIPGGIPSPAYVNNVLKVTEATWRKENPRASIETIQSLEFSMAFAEATMPQYFKYWEDDFRQVKWLGVESEFRIPISIPVLWNTKKEIKTFIRGKMDGNFEDTQTKALWLFETKTKSHINEEVLADLLPHELQVNIYTWAMFRLLKRRPTGVRYNLIRRPGLRQRQTETSQQFAVRCAEDVKVRPDWYFVRLDMDFDKADLEKFEGEFQDLLVDFINWWYGHAGHYKNSNQCENKYGKCQFLAACGRKEFAGLYRRDTVFRELEEV